jgi:cytidylate kinase
MRVIAIDGPAGAGKSTVAKHVASATGLPYLDTGAMYRCIAYAAGLEQVDINDAEAMGAVARGSKVQVEGTIACLNGSDVSHLIRSPEINQMVSVIAAHTPVRDAMREQQRSWIADHEGGVVEGRDIGTVVFPDAVLKIFLTASAEVRAQRRVQQVGGDVLEIAASIAQRDHLDSHRIDSPLRPAPDSHTVDSSVHTIDEVVTEIVNLFREASDNNG